MFPAREAKLETVLKNNGGPTDTHALLSDSTAINAGDDALAPATDQRAFLRDGTSDIGAFEFNGAAPAPPTVTTGAATNITSTSATLNATVNPNGFAATFHFTTDFGFVGTADAGTGKTDVSFSPDVTGLAPGTQYHFRAIASSVAGTTEGEEQTFTTLAGPTPTPTATPVPTATATPTPTPGSLGNISTRLRVETGDNVLIGGFIVTGTEPKKVIIRAIGPSLPVNGALADPTLDLFSGQTVLASNDNWMESPDQQAIIDSTVPPGNASESAIVATLPAEGAAYTAIVRGAGETSGVGLVEVYDLDQAADSRLANISTRGLVQTGDDVMIGGLYVVGSTSQRVIVRAIGPSLPVDGKLVDPTLELRDGNGALVDANDNWRSDHEAEIISTTVSPTEDAESAVVQTLAPGPYTAIVRGVSETTGVALVEVYGLPDLSLVKR